jgi:hypothetical protein
LHPGWWIPFVPEPAQRNALDRVVGSKLDDCIPSTRSMPTQPNLLCFGTARPRTTTRPARGQHPKVSTFGSTAAPGGLVRRGAWRPWQNASLISSLTTGEKRTPGPPGVAVPAEQRTRERRHLRGGTTGRPPFPLVLWRDWREQRQAVERGETARPKISHFSSARMRRLARFGPSASRGARLLPPYQSTGFVSC